jgi:alpha-L-arabinofuranosidase
MCFHALLPRFVAQSGDVRNEPSSGRVWGKRRVRSDQQLKPMSAIPAFFWAPIGAKTADDCLDGRTAYRPLAGRLEFLCGCRRHERDMNHLRKPIAWARTLLLLTLSLPTLAPAQDQDVYTDSIQNGWESWGWASLNYANSTPVHSGTKSVSISATAWQAMYLHHAAFDTSSYTKLRFWIHGGTQGGQRLQVQALLSGTAQQAVALPALTANAWTLVEIPLSSLGVQSKPNMDGFWVQDVSGIMQPTFYIDDVQMVGVAAPSVVSLNVDANQILRLVDDRMFAINAAVWDAQFNTPTTAMFLTDMGNKVLRFPGGSLSDEYHWRTNTSLNNTWTWATSFDAFAGIARQAGSQAFITVNYGSGTAQEAADWVQYSNVTKGYGFKYWEIGNENYGNWERDEHARPNDPYTYAQQSKLYIDAMKSIDPTIKIGVVMVTGEDNYANYSDHPATNPRTGQVHNGWNPVMLATLKSLGVTPDFVVYHKYDQAPGQESDQGLLQSSSSWARDVADLRQQLNDYLGASAASVEIVCTENNSVYTNPGKQTTSLVNGLFMADSIGQALQTELKGLVWWDLRNDQATSNNNSSSLYGWRLYGDYGVASPGNDRYPTYFVAKLMKYWARGADSVVRATSDFAGLPGYAVKRPDGSLALLVINKDATVQRQAQISLSGYTPSSSATVYSYGIPQDEAARTGVGSIDVASTSFAVPGATFSYTFAPYSVTVISIGGTTPPPPPPVTIPAAPTSLVATAISRTRIDLRWIDNSSNEDGFKIERSQDGVSFAQIATVAANTTTYPSTGLAGNRTYYYRVRAYNAAGNSAYTNVASAKTPKR